MTAKVKCEDLYEKHKYYCLYYDFFFHYSMSLHFLSSKSQVINYI